ncbi:MAG: hypothetical protein K2Y21_06545 [Phycisphaerales bacterium]|nr:hypothetical protein [Phycisphaerales bacterium]
MIRIAAAAAVVVFASTLSAAQPGAGAASGPQLSAKHAEVAKPAKHKKHKKHHKKAGHKQPK